jgi:hypothetical protein
MRTKQFEIGLSTFEKIRTAFPALTMNLDFHHKDVDLAMDIPAQIGLSFPVHLDLQNLDELHLGASKLWVSWFPCTNRQRVVEYFEAVSGLLSGRYRILEHWRGRRTVKAVLQRPSGAEWKSVAGSSHLLSVPWPPKTFRVVQNTLFPQSHDLEKP